MKVQKIMKKRGCLEIKRNMNTPATEVVEIAPERKCKTDKNGHVQQLKT